MVAAPHEPFANHEVRELTGHKHKVLTLGWNCNGKRLASGAADGSIKIWRIDPKHGRPERSEADLVGHTAAVTYIRWDPLNIERLATMSNDKTLRLWDARSSKCLGSVTSNNQLLSMTWRPDGSVIMVVDKSDSVLAVDTRTVKVTRTVRYHVEINELLWMKDGKHVFIAMGDGSVQVTTYPGFEALRSFSGHSTSVYHLCLDPIGRYLATGATDACIALWDLTDLVCVRTFVGMDNEINNLSFTPDGRYLTYIDSRLGLCIVDVETGHTVHRVALSPGHVPQALDWNPKHQVLAWPGAFQQDSRDSSRDSGPILILSPKQ